jgi:hypothetical protein
VVLAKAEGPQMMEFEGTDALIARNRLLAELAGCTDKETGVSLWRAMARYHWKDKLERIGRLEIEADPLPARVQGALGGARELMAE